MVLSRDTGSRSRYQSPPPTTTTGTIPTPPEQQGPIDIATAIDQAIAEAGAAGGAGPQPLGVNPTFQVRQPYGPSRQRAPGSHGFDLGGGPGARTIGPRYFADDEYAPANYAPNIIARMQQQLAKVGLFDANATVVSGDWGEETASAFRRLLAYANQHGLPWQVALDNLRTQVEGANGPSGAFATGAGGRFRIDKNGNLVDVNSPADREPLLIRTTDPRTLDILFREMSTKMLGQTLSQDQVANMTAAYNQMETQRQQEAYDKQVTGGSVLDIPSAESFGQAQIEAQHPEEVAANTGLNYLSDAMSMLGSPAWGIGR